MDEKKTNSFMKNKVETFTNGRKFYSEITEQKNWMSLLNSLVFRRFSFIWSWKFFYKKKRLAIEQYIQYTVIIQYAVDI